jgi:hypothetical protein
LLHRSKKETGCFAVVGTINADRQAARSPSRAVIRLHASIPVSSPRRLIDNIDTIKKEVIVSREWEPITWFAKLTSKTPPNSIEQTIIFRLNANDSIKTNQQLAPHRENPVFRAMRFRG